MDAATVVLLQHGEKVRTAGDPGLAELGRAQASAAAEALSPLRPAAIVASPLRRARETAAVVAGRCGLPVETDARLRERLNWEPGVEPAAFFAAWERTLREPAWTPSFGRSSEATGADMLAALNAHAVPGRVAILATHGGATVDLLRLLLGDPELDRRSPGILGQGVPGGALTTLCGLPGGWRVEAIADVAHLATGERTGHLR